MSNKKIFMSVFLLTLAASGIVIGQSTTSRTKAKPKSSAARTQPAPASSVKTKKPKTANMGDTATHEVGHRTAKPASNAPKATTLPERGDEVLVTNAQQQTPQNLGNFEIQRLNRPANSPNPNARPFQQGSGDGQSIRRKQPRGQSINPDRPTSELAVQNPNAQPVKNATTRPKPLVKQDPNGNSVGGKPKTQRQRPPNGPAGKPKRAPIKRIEREPIESPVVVTPGAGEWRDKTLDEVTESQPPPSNGSRTKAPNSGNRTETVDKDESIPVNAKAAAPTEEVRLERTSGSRSSKAATPSAEAKSRSPKSA